MSWRLRRAGDASRCRRGERERDERELERDDSRRRPGERERERGSRRRAEEANGWVPSLEALSRSARVIRSALSRSKRPRLLALQASLQNTPR